MSSNYPPGVTGNEPQIAGTESQEEIRDCPTCEEEIAGTLTYISRTVAEWECAECENILEIDLMDNDDYSERGER